MSTTRARLLVAKTLLQLSGAADHGVRRGIDLAWSVTLLLLGSPLLLLLPLSYALNKKPLRSQLCWGKNRRSFHLYQLDGAEIVGGTILQRLQLENLMGLLINVIKGDLTLVGPRPLPVSGPTPDTRFLSRRCRVTPGVVCLWWLHDRVPVATKDECQCDLEYLQKRGLSHDIGILFRCLVSLLNGRTEAVSGKASLNGISFDNVSMREAIAQIEQCMESKGLSRIAFINADCMNLASHDSEYRSALQSADRVFADGVGIKIAGRMAGCRVKENVNGTDLFPALCHSIASSGRRIFLLGGRPGIPERVRDWIHTHAPGVTVCGFHHGYFETSEQSELIRQIDASGAEIVLVAFGAPKQELWIRNTLPASRVRAAIGVGGLFDFYSGRIPRAPLWMRQAGLEWTYRLYQEPRRLWRRYVIGNFTFLARTLIYRLKHGRSEIRDTVTPTFGKAAQ